MAIINYKTSLYTYNEFIKENKTNRLSKNEKLEQPGAGVVNFLNIEKIDEIFDSKIDKLEYEENAVDKKHGNITYFFKSKSNTEYRLDLVVLLEKNEDIKDERLHNKRFISVSFSLSNSNYENYDDQTNLNELYDVMSRIRYLIQLNEYKTNLNYIFMFGKPAENKINMYKYFIKICFPDYKLIVDYTSGFPNTNVGYYLLK